MDQSVHHRSRAPMPARILLLSLLGVVAAACGGASAGGPTPAVSSAASAGTSTILGSPPAAAPGATSVAPGGDAGASSPATGGAAAEMGATTKAGDIADNAVFLTYASTRPAFSIEYVEGWQVAPSTDGVTIRDKDSTETVAVASPATDVAGWIASTDLPALRAIPGFTLLARDRVAIGPTTYEHASYHLLAPPDPVTGKQVPSTVDRYYVPGSGGLAVVTLSTPDGVDNVDAFRRMIESFRWH